MLQSTLGKYYLNSNTYSSTCQLCQKEDESISHFLLECTTLSRIRKKCLKQLKKTLQKAEIDVPSSQDALLKLILNGSEDEILNKSCADFCLKLHTKRFKILDDKGLIYRKKKKKKKYTPDPKDCCIFCKKIVKDDHKAVECERCLKWQHIKCERIMDGWKYSRIIKGKETFLWRCAHCSNGVEEDCSNGVEEEC